jgi:hypothetical protein
MNEDIRRMLVYGLMFNCPYNQEDGCKYIETKRKFKANAREMMQEMSKEKIDEIIDGHMECKYCLDREVFKKFVDIGKRP